MNRDTTGAAEVDATARVGTTPDTPVRSTSDHGGGGRPGWRSMNFGPNEARVPSGAPKPIFLGVS